MINTVLMCSKLLTLTSLFKMRNIKPLNKTKQTKTKQNFRKNWKFLLIYSFEDSSSTKYNDLIEDIFLKFNLNLF